MTPAEVLARMLRSDPAGPRVTFYDDQPGPTQGERIELSAKVLANWVAKAGNMLQDELDVEAGAVVGLDLPAEHWRTLYWALAVWSVGATVSLTGRDDADVLVTTRPDDGPAEQVAVTLAALARRSPVALPRGVVDEAHELATFPDQLTPYAAPAPGDAALRTAAGTFAYADVVPGPAGEAGRRVFVQGDTERVLRESLGAWADDGSVLLMRDADPLKLRRRLGAEGATPLP